LVETAAGPAEKNFQLLVIQSETNAGTAAALGCPAGLSYAVWLEVDFNV
jgi:hypothetical protein